MQLLGSTRQVGAVYHLKVDAAARRIVSISAPSGNLNFWTWDMGYRMLPIRFRQWGEAAALQDPTSMRHYRERNGDFYVRRGADVAISSDGSRVACVGPRSALEIYGPREPSPLVVGAPGQFASLCFDKTGRRLIATGWMGVRPPPLDELAVPQAALIDVDAGLVLAERVLVGSPVVLHPSGQLFVSALNDEDVCHIRFHRTSNSLEPTKRIVEDSVRITAIECSPDGRSLAYVSQDSGFGISVLDMPTLKPKFSRFYEYPRILPFHYQPRWCCAFGADGYSIFWPTPSGHVIELDSHSGAELNCWRAHESSILSIAVREDLGLIFTGDAVGLIKVWRLPPSHSPKGASDPNRVVQEFNALDISAATTTTVTVSGEGGRHFYPLPT